MKYKTPKTEELFDCGVHIGHQARRWHPKMEKYLFSSENKIHIFDLEQTEELLKQACEFLFETAKKGGQIIFVGTKRQASAPTKEAAIKSGALYMNERWLGGTITNFKMIKKNVEKLVGFIKKREDGSLQKYTKKERLLIDREIEKLEKYVGGIVNLKGTPAALVVIDPRKEKTAVREAVRSDLPVVALIDSNSDPSLITYPIPGNDDAIKSINLIINTLASAVEEGYKEFAKAGTDAEEKAIKDAASVETAPVIITAVVADAVVKEGTLPIIEEVSVESAPIAEVLTKEIPAEKITEKTVEKKSEKKPEKKSEKVAKSSGKKK
jgi:small subunit ribosomal protein S2